MINMYLKIILILSLFSDVFCNEMKTILRKERNILLRKRRYIDFPEGSSFTISFSFVKAVMVQRPKGYMSLLECDVPFALPSAKDRRKKLHQKFKYVEKRSFTSKWSSVFDRLGLDGESCSNRILCEAKAFVESKKNFIISKIINVLFNSNMEEGNCTREVSNCPLPPLPEIITKILKIDVYNY